ncbi:MAG: hypothetical protein GC158_17285 [Cyanobacteria bacterium RI_101]|nr:hypothetical protein [Cyanobacteria bacterium RI_101]
MSILPAPLSQSLKTLVKIASCLAIGAALFLEVNQFWSFIPAPWPPLLWFAHLALVGHGIEAVVAVIYGLTQGRSFGEATVQGIKVFWTGTVGLTELLKRPESPSAATPNP